MKKFFGVLTIFAALVLTVAPARAVIGSVQTQTAAPAAPQGTCTDESKAAWYADFTKNRTIDAKAAYEAGKKYLTACPTEEGQIPAYLKKWVAAYEKEARKLQLTDLFVRQRKYAEAMTLAKELLADEPENVTPLIYLGYGGYVVAVTTKNESGNADAANYTRKAIQAIEAGKTPADWAPFKTKDDALGYLYYSLGYLERASNATNALANFIKAATYDSEIKKNPQTYVFITASYEAEYAKQSAEYERLYKGKDETPESKLAVANINQLVDRIIDSLARAVASASTDAAGQQAKAVWLARLTELYKFRNNNSDAGLNEMIAGVLAKPIPPVPTPLTSLPAAPATSTTTPATNPTGSPANAATTAPAAKPAATSTAPKTTTAAETATTKPATKPKSRNNHRRP